jgi:ubiquinone/menaquinone biosynthesis C-methylase UbiE
MSLADRILLRMFGRPKGILGRLGGLVLARFNRGFAQEIVALLNPRAAERVLEVGFGPGVGIELLASAASMGKIAGVDPSEEMVKQAMARNAAAIRNGAVDLRQGSVESMPFEDGAFETALAINSMQVWPDAPAGLREIRRVLTGGGRVALGFTPNSRQPKSGVTELLSAAGFEATRLVDLRGGFCALAHKPDGGSARSRRPAAYAAASGGSVSASSR